MSCKPRPEESQTTAGMTRLNRRVRIIAAANPTYPFAVCSVRTRMPHRRWPIVCPSVATKIIVTTTNTPSCPRACPLNRSQAIPLATSQSMINAMTRRPSGAGDPGPCSGMWYRRSAASRLPSCGVCPPSQELKSLREATHIDYPPSDEHDLRRQCASGNVGEERRSTGSAT